MSFDRLLKLQLSIARQRSFKNRFKGGVGVPFRILFAILFSRRTYLLWTVAFAALQLAELLVLAKVHYIYFPPASLSLLRALSALGLIGILCAAVLKTAKAGEATAPLAEPAARLLKLL